MGSAKVEVTFFGGEELGPRGGWTKGEKVLVGIAVERHEPYGFDRCRMVNLGGGSADSLHLSATADVEPGTKVVTTSGVTIAGTTRWATSISAQPAGRFGSQHGCQRTAPRRPPRRLLRQRGTSGLTTAESMRTPSELT
jgi:hypothetical protein